MTTTLTDLQIINQALRNLGEDPLATYPETTTKRGNLVSNFYETVRDATLAGHPWTFATQRRRLLAYTEPTGTLTPGAGALTVGTTGVIFTASASGTFAATDVGKTLQGDGVVGKATITGFTSGTIVTATITEAFSALTAIATGSWRLYYAAPPWTEQVDALAYTIPKPSDVLAVYSSKDTPEDGNPIPLWAVESDGTQEVIVTDTDQFDCTVILQVTSPLRWNALFVRAFQAHLSATFAENITGKAALVERYWNLYEAILKKAKGQQMLESPRRIRRSSPLVEVRAVGIQRGSTGVTG